jgi:hypothetical protein
VNGASRREVASHQFDLRGGPFPEWTGV